METPQSATLAFIDTETTSLRPDRRAWEIGLLLRWPSHADRKYRWFIHTADLDLGNADLGSLRIGRFFDRHPEYAAERTPDDAELSDDGISDDGIWAEAVALRELEELTRGAHLIGAVPSFDAEVLATRMREHGICPSWHYHLQDFETLIAGYLYGQGKPVPELPWRSDELSRLIGVEPPGEADRHTALGDAYWAARVWDAVTGAPA